MKLNLLFIYFFVSQMQNNSCQWQFSVWHKKTFGIINHPLSNCDDFLMEKMYVQIANKK